MGSFEVDLTELRSQAVSKKWHALEGGEGEIELALQWYTTPLWPTTRSRKWRRRCYEDAERALRRRGHKVET